MRLALPLLAPLLMASTVPRTAPAPIPPLKNTSAKLATHGLNCGGKIETVREERGLPKLDRGNATPDEPLFIAAVDKRIDGCEVMVMKNNTGDIRPLPEYHDGPGRMQRLR